MKTHLYYATFAILLLSIVSNAQTPWYENGNSALALKYIGTNNGYDFPIYTNGTEKARLLTSGEFGLGTASPASWFHILTNGSGTVAASEAFRTVVPSSTDINWRAYRNTTQMFRLNVPQSGNSVFLQSPQGDFKIGTGNTGTIIPSFMIKGGSGADAGNTSFGDYATLTSPQALLHLYKSASVDFQMTNSTTGNTNTDGFRIVDDNTGTISLYNWENTDLFFGTGNVGSGLSNRMVIRGGTHYGRVGIATNAPGAQLDVYDNIDISISGDDMAFRSDEILATSNTVNRAVGASVHAENGVGTLGLGIAVDNTSSNSGVDLTGIHTRCRNTNASNVSDSYNFYAENDGACTSTNKYGIAAFMSGSGSTNSYGGWFTSNSSAGTNWGVFGNATGTAFNYGVRGEASSGTNNYGVWGSAPIQTCTTTPLGVTTCAGAAGYFVGDVFASANVYNTSDFKLKDQITNVNNASSLLASMQCKQFIFKN